MKIQALLVDDEPLARQRIRRLLKGEQDIEVAGECATGREAIRMIQDVSPDLVFLDIQMPEVSGFEVLQALGKVQPPAVIFTTAHDQHALKAFEVHALDYLLKPFTQARFAEALARARTQLAASGGREPDPRLALLIENLRPEQSYLRRFVVRSSSRILLVNAADVDWIESADNYALLHVGDQTHVVRETMRALEEKLSPQAFQRISRSAIVNLSRIKELQPMGKGEYIVILGNGTRLSMSRGIRDLQRALDPS
jgi:two-component system, LytTR family, response regulator